MDVRDGNATVFGGASGIGEGICRALVARGAMPGGLRGPESLGPMMTLLASDGADYMTGQVLSLDGGVCMLGS